MNNLSDTCIAENLLWAMLCTDKLRGARFHKKVIFRPYTLDFYSPPTRIYVLIGDESEENDRKARYLDRHFGIRTCRFTASQIIHNPDDVIHRIRTAVVEAGGSPDAPRLKWNGHTEKK